MLLFRSEEHVERWRNERDRSRGALLTVETQWRLAQAWYADRADPDWKRRTPEQAQAVFRSVGLDGPFWNLPG